MTAYKHADSSNSTCRVALARSTAPSLLLSLLCILTICLPPAEALADQMEGSLSSSIDPWLQEGQIAVLDAPVHSMVGNSVAISGDTLVIGGRCAVFPCHISQGTGAAWVFVRTAGVWTEQAKLTPSDGTPPDETPFDLFGASVAISGDTILVGAPRDFIADEPGAVYVFTRSEGSWSEEAKLTASDGTAGDTFGISVAIEGNTAVIGATWVNATEGSAYVFTRAGGIWTEQTKLSPSDGAEGLSYGRSVAISAGTLIVGAPYGRPADPGAGAAYVFTNTNGDWVEQVRIAPPDGILDQRFGWAVALSSDTALIGGRIAPSPFARLGSAYVFVREEGEEGEWGLQSKLPVSDFPHSEFTFGYSVALSGDRALVGAYLADLDPDANDDTGVAFMYSRDGESWSDEVVLHASEEIENQRFGYAVALQDDIALVGAPGLPGLPPFLESDSNAGSGYSGAVYAFFNPPANFGVIEGTVASLHCGGNIGAISGAVVELSGSQGTHTRETDHRGFYRAILPDDESPLDITVTAPGHVPATIEDVTFSGGDAIVLDVDLFLDAPCATADPTSMSAAIDPNQSTTETLSIGNVDGVAELTWEIATALPAVVRHRSAGRRLSDDSGAQADHVDHGTASVTGTTIDLASGLGDLLPSLRPISPAGGIVDCDGETGIIIHDDGTIESGYSGNPDTVAQAIFADRFTPSAYPASFSSVCVSFVSLGPSTLDFEIVVFDDDGPDGSPGTELGAVSVTAEDIPIVSPPLPPGFEPTWFSYDISSLDVSIDSGSVFIGVRYAPSDPIVVVTADASPGNPIGFAGGYWWNSVTGAWAPIEDSFSEYRSLFVRAVEDPGGCLDPTTVQWLSVDPASGATAVGGSSDVQVTFDSTGLVAGESRAASICVTSNDPVNSLIVVPVTLNVTIPPDFATIEGTVEGLGYCTADPGPVTDTELVIESQEQTYVVTVDGNGFYQGAFNPAEGPVDITVSAPGHHPQTVTDIELVAGETVIQNFDLLLDAPCAEVDPGDVAIELPSGGSETVELTIGNTDGGATLDWTVETAKPPTATDRNTATPTNATVGIAHRSSTAHQDSAGDSTGTKMGLASVLGKPLPNIRPINPAGGAVDCDAEPGLIAHDDGGIEASYIGIPQFVLVDRFTPSGYPASFNAVCVAWVAHSEPGASQDFDIVVYDDDGPSGGPGTELGALSATTTDIPVWPIPEPTWISVDISSLDISIDSGSVYIGVRWSTSAATVALTVDESPDRPAGFAGGHFRHQEGEPWQRIEESGNPAFIDYRSLFVRAVHSAVGCDDPSTIPWLSASPAAGSSQAGESTSVQATIDTVDLSPGEHRASLCITTNDEAKPLVVVPVTMTVAGPDLAFTPSPLDFGDVEVGTISPPLTATLHNTGNADATGLSFAPTGAGFDAEAGDCGATLPVNASCEIVLTFTPAEVGPAAAALQVSSTEGVSAVLDLVGRGFGVAAFTPIALEVDPIELVSNGNNVFEPSELIDVLPSWRNDGIAGASLTATASDFAGPEGAIYSLGDTEADYGLVEPGSTGDCQEVGVCYRLGVDDPAIRPATHWEATFDETLDDTDGTTQTWTLHIGESFADVPTTNAFYPAIETLLHSGVASGCGGSEYCPQGVNTRSQIAVFLMRGVEGADYVPPACAEGDERFDDVPADNLFCSWVEALAERGITSGCGDSNYCPADSVTRGQMAVFLLKAAEGDGYTPPPCTGEFDDVPCSSVFAAWIEELAARGITSGCSAGNYCPADEVTRAQMAVFVTRTFGLTLYGP